VPNLLENNRSPEKNSTTQDAEDMQGNGEILTLDPWQDSEKLHTGSSKPVVTIKLTFNA